MNATCWNRTKNKIWSFQTIFFLLQMIHLFHLLVLFKNFCQQTFSFNVCEFVNRSLQRLPTSVWEEGRGTVSQRRVHPHILRWQIPHTPPLFISAVMFGSKVGFCSHCVSAAALPAKITQIFWWSSQTPPPPGMSLLQNPPAIHQFLINICILDCQGCLWGVGVQGVGGTRTHKLILINWNKISLELERGAEQWKASTTTRRGRLDARVLWVHPEHPLQQLLQRPAEIYRFNPEPLTLI